MGPPFLPACTCETYPLRNLHCCSTFLGSIHGIQEATGCEPNCPLTNWISVNSSYNFCCSNSLHHPDHDWTVLGLPACPNFSVTGSLLISQSNFTRVVSLFTTDFHTHTTTYYGFHVASSMHNFATMIATIIVLVSVPPSVYPPPHGHRVPGHTGGSQMAGGSRESHLTIKQTENNHLSVLPLTHTITFTHSRTTICFNQLTSLDSEGPKGGRRKGGRGRRLSHFSFCCAFRSCVVYSPCFPVWGEEKVMTIYDAGPLAAGPLCGLLMDGLVCCNFTVVSVSAVVWSFVFWCSGKKLTFAFTSSRRRADDSSGKILSFRGLRAASIQENGGR